MPIEFERDVQTATFYSPLADFEEVDAEAEVREDPLTGRQARIVSGGFVMPEEDPDIESFVTDDEGCFFCPGTVQDATPEYPDWVGFDRGSVGEATSFPNLNPYGTHSNVVALTEDHYVPMDEFTAETFEDGLTAALEYVAAAFEHDDSATFASVNMNYLRSAGSSIVHPHLQALVDDRGTDAQVRTTRAARAYHDEHGSTYWHDLLAAERDGERWVGSTSPVDWVAAFAPKHHRHVVGVVDGVDVLGPGDEAAVAGLAEGITNVLGSYAESGLNAHNLALHLSDDPAVPPVIDVCNRAVFGQYYWSDATFFTTLHDEAVVGAAPEEYAGDLREWF